MHATFAFANCFMLFGVSRVNVKPVVSKNIAGDNVVLGVIGDLKSGITYVAESRHLLILMGLSLFFAFCLDFIASVFL